MDARNQKIREGFVSQIESHINSVNTAMESYFAIAKDIRTKYEQLELLLDVANQLPDFDIGDYKDRLESASIGWVFKIVDSNLDNEQRLKIRWERPSLMLDSEE